MDDFQGGEPALHAAEGDHGAVDYKEVRLVVVLQAHGERVELFGDQFVEDGLEEGVVLGECGPDLLDEGLVGLGDAAQFGDSI